MPWELRKIIYFCTIFLVLNLITEKKDKQIDFSRRDFVA